MGMSMHITAIREEDEQYRKMAAAYEACQAAGVSLPKEVEDYFDDAPPSGGPAVALQTFGKDKHRAVSEYKGDMEEGFTVDLRCLPERTVKLRFYCVW